MGLLQNMLFDTKLLPLLASRAVFRTPASAHSHLHDHAWVAALLQITLSLLHQFSYQQNNRAGAVPAVPKQVDEFTASA
jgi:hypothetical protein